MIYVYISICIKRLNIYLKKSLIDPLRNVCITSIATDIYLYMRKAKKEEKEGIKSESSKL